MANLSERLRTRVAEVERSLAELDQPRREHHAHVLPALPDWDAVAAGTEETLGGAEKHVYLFTRAEHLAGFASAIKAAQDRGVRFDRADRRSGPTEPSRYRP
ncbi:hypothetical protein [Amycolatopsis rifamycinica]|uniref:Uncharacterized protein n=1 Tax=Amycolatopsis rifamycinica TaxID=287986 RepID=A0A066UC92_9PSEU|nr:hypothetical protein [Amycolatopsis rifamycinica]KDN21853.1 hypothetical protein DV20_13060 [Amycolatopsis rifamycinica]